MTKKKQPKQNMYKKLQKFVYHIGILKSKKGVNITLTLTSDLKTVNVPAMPLFAPATKSVHGLSHLILSSHPGPVLRFTWKYVYHSGPIVKED